MVLLSHFHSLSSFVFSCGLTQKLDGLSSPKLKTPPATLSTPQTPTGGPAVPQHNILTAENILQQQSLNAAAAVPPQHPQKTVLSEITLNNNNNNNSNSIDHHNHQVYCNNNAEAVAAAAAAVNVSHSSGVGGMPHTGVAAGASTNAVNGVNKLNGKLRIILEIYRLIKNLNKQVDFIYTVKNFNLPS